MRRLRRILLLTAAILLSLGASCVYNPAEDGYQVVWEDNFDTLDTSVWTPGQHSTGPASVTDGVLRLTDDPTASATAISTSGPRASTKPSFPDQLAWQDGYFEARIRFSSDSWTWPIFWLWSASKANAWPGGQDCNYLTSEWDVLEGGLDNGNGLSPARSSMHTVLHRNTPDSGSPGGEYCGQPDTMDHFNYRAPDGIDFSDWHTWSGRWVGDQLCTFLDGVQIGCLAAYDSTAQPMQIVFSVGYHGLCGGCGPQPAEVWMEVDWVRVWQK